MNITLCPRLKNEFANEQDNYSPGKPVPSNSILQLVLVESENREPTIALSRPILTDPA